LYTDNAYLDTHSDKPFFTDGVNKYNAVKHNAQ